MEAQRTRRRYDHRFRSIVHETGDIELAVRKGVAIIWGIDRLLDMVRTAVNITGDAMITTIVGKWEGQVDTDIFNQKVGSNGSKEG